MCSVVLTLLARHTQLCSLSDAQLRTESVNANLQLAQFRSRLVGHPCRNRVAGLCRGRLRKGAETEGPKTTFPIIPSEWPAGNKSLHHRHI